MGTYLHRMLVSKSKSDHLKLQICFETDRKKNNPITNGNCMRIQAIEFKNAFNYCTLQPGLISEVNDFKICCFVRVFYIFV